MFLWSRACRCVRLITSPSSLNRFSRHVGPVTSHNPTGLNGLLRRYNCSLFVIYGYFHMPITPHQWCTYVKVIYIYKFEGNHACIFFVLPGLCFVHYIFQIVQIVYIPVYVLKTQTHKLRSLKSYTIWGFHGGDHEECRLLGCGC
jgi:hypothetical protein